MTSNGLLFAAEVNDTAVRAVAASKRAVAPCREAFGRGHIAIATDDHTARVFDTLGP